MSTAHRRILVLGVAAAVGLLGLTSCTAKSSETIADGTKSVPENSTVTVSRGSITSVLVLDGVVTVAPKFSILATKSGVLAYESKFQSGTLVNSGDVVATVDGADIHSPASGTVELMGQPSGMTVAKNLPIATVAYSGFGVSSDVPPEKLYRLSSEPVTAKASIQYGPAGVACTLVPLDGAVASDADGPNFQCLLPLGTEVAPGMSGSVGLALEEKAGVLVLPVSTVRGSAQKGLVSKVVDGKSQEVPVDLGITDGNKIEIVSGLAEGDVVLGNPPRLVDNASH